MSCFFKFLYSFFLFLINDPQALRVNPGCLKCILEMKNEKTNKNLFTISLIL